MIIKKNVFELPEYFQNVKTKKETQIVDLYTRRESNSPAEQFKLKTITMSFM